MQRHKGWLYNSRKGRRKSKNKKIKSDINEISRGTKNPEKRKRAIKNIKTFYESLEKVIKLFNDYSKIVYKAKYKTIYGESSKY